MRKTMIVTTLIFLGVLMPSTARAGGFLTPFLGVTFGADAPASRVTYGVAAGGMIAGIFGAEVDFGHTPNFFDRAEGDRPSVTTLMVNLLVGAPLGSFQPYVSAGLGVIRQGAELTPSGVLNDISSNDFGLNAGAGARVRVGGPFGIRADVRYFTVRKSGGLGFWRGYGGLSLGF